MLKSLETWRDYKIKATDGQIGSIDDFYFDDQDWAVRYFVVDIGNWFGDQKVLLAPAAIESVDWGAEMFLVNLTKEDVEASPAIDTARPYSHQQMMKQPPTYPWPPIGRLGGGLLNENLVGMHPNSIVETIKAKKQATETASTPRDNSHLRSANEVSGYYIRARDGEIGHVEDFLVHQETWAIHYIVVDTRNWLPGKKVLVSPAWIKEVAWNQASVYVDLSRETIENSPEFSPQS